MNPFEAMIRQMAEKAADEKRFEHLTREQHVEMNTECNRAFWKCITFNTLADGDDRGRDIQQLLTVLRTADMSQYHIDHALVDEDEAPRKESKLRCKFWDEFYDMVDATVKYAEYCGYITFDSAAAQKENDAIHAKYEAMKLSTDNEQQ